jgi:outer membrane protein assembly factor BamA
LAIAVIAFIVAAGSCTVPKKFQAGKPFVYKTDVKLVNSDLPKSDRLQLKEALRGQIDDSLQVRTVLAFGLSKPFGFYYRLSRPAVFDTLYIGRSKTFMNALLNSRGYFSPQITDTLWIDTVRRGKQMRTHVQFFVKHGVALRYDSIGYDLQDSALQRLTMQSLDESLLKKNDPYSVQNISLELDRLLNTYHDHGYFKMNKEDLYAELDTVVAALIDPGLDPFEQFELIDSLSRKTREPTIKVVIKQRTPKDSSHLQTYRWGKINVYPDKQILEENPSAVPDSVKIDGYTIFPTSNRFKLPFIARNITVRPGALYRQSDYFKTINTFTNLGAWQQVDVNVKPRSDTSRILDADILLYPAKKQSLNIDFETSRNASDVLTTGNLFGIGLNLGVRNRNAFRESISSSSNLRFGVELGTDIIQTVQASFAHNIYVPRFLTPFKIKNEKNLTNPRTIINFSTAYTHRREFFDVRSVNTSWGYDWSKKNRSWQYLPFNFEYTDVNKYDSLLRLEETFPSLKQAFNNGLIISQILAFTTGKTKGNINKSFHAKLEESGALFGLFKNIDRGELRRFIKLDLEYKYFINNPHSTWAFRLFGGYGLVYGKSGDTLENNLPFFKAYFGGGPYSMRAWAVRRLGLGSTAIFDQKKIDRFGDMQLEGNVEYRFDLGTLWGIKLKSALFTDVGNIWGKTYDDTYKRVDSAEFKLGRLYTDLAVGAGTSLRFDFDFFLIRLDWAYQIKNPAFAKENDGWFHNLQLKDGQFQLGIGYPFSF